MTPACVSTSHLLAKSSSSALAARTGGEERERDVLRPDSVSIEVRRACWDRLWQILLRDLPNDDVEQRESEPSNELAETNEAAPRASSGKEVATGIA
jgi:hypothetical protein